MTGGQRSRLLKTGGLIVLVLMFLYLFTSRDSAGVRDLVKGLSRVYALNLRKIPLADA